MLVDLTMPVRVGMPVLLGHATTMIYPTSTHEEMAQLGAPTTFRVEALHMSTHEGTHVDVPAHLRPEGDTVADLPLERFRTPGICLDVADVGSDVLIDPEHLEHAEEQAVRRVRPGDTVLLCTGHVKRTYPCLPDWYRHNGLSEEAAEWLVDRGVAAVGIDAPSIDSSRETRRGGYPAHRVLLADHDVLIVENLTNLEQTVGRDFRYTGFPLLLHGAGGAPVRAVAELDVPWGSA